MDIRPPPDVRGPDVRPASEIRNYAPQKLEPYNSDFRLPPDVRGPDVRPASEIRNYAPEKLEPYNSDFRLPPDVRPASEIRNYAPEKLEPYNSDFRLPPDVRGSDVRPASEIRSFGPEKFEPNNSDFWPSPDVRSLFNSTVVPDIFTALGRLKPKRKRLASHHLTPKATEKVGISTPIPKAQDEPAEPHTKAFDDLPDTQDEPPSPQKEAAENLNPPSPKKAAEDMTPDLDQVFITGTCYSEPASTVLTKHTSKDTPILIEKGMTKLKLPNIEKLDFEELHSGYPSRLAASRDMETSLVNMMKKK
ncbi:hypothetical protein ZWY2020_056839 [Hordeum vulgare]|nr:hypothetical protein ZWY2020_056839 [Hordeum vulgare]